MGVYTSFIPRAVGLIRSMLSFEKSIVKDSQDMNAEAEDKFFLVMDEAFAGMDSIALPEFLSRLEECRVLTDSRELGAVRHLLSPFGEEVPVEEAKSQVWALLKIMRRH